MGAGSNAACIFIARIIYIADLLNSWTAGIKNNDDGADIPPPTQESKINGEIQPAGECRL